VLEAVRISCAGFPSKRPFPDFVDHFWSLAPELYHRQDLDDRCARYSKAWGVCQCAGAAALRVSWERHKGQESSASAVTPGSVGAARRGTPRGLP
jgi:hypothetical protein